MILSHEYRYFQCRRHKHSPYHRMFVTVLCCIFEDWSWIFRTRSFTLCKNDLDINDMSDSATVWESTSSLSTINLTVCRANKPGGCSLTGLPVLTLPSIHQISTLEKTKSCQHSTQSILMSKRSKQTVLWCCSFHELRSNYLVFPWAFWCSGS